MKTLLKLCLFLSAGVLLAACSGKSDATPSYKTPEGLHVSANAEYSGALYLSGRERLSAIIFYSDTFPVLSLRNATITIYSLSGPDILLAKQGLLSAEPSLSLNLSDESFFPTVKSPGNSGFPDCSTEGYMFWVYFSLPENMGSYDFYFRIEDPALNLYYQTPVYRLNLVPHGEKPADWYIVNINELEKQFESTTEPKTFNNENFTGTLSIHLGRHSACRVFRF